MNFFVEKNQIRDSKIIIIGTDVNHIKNVLRKNIGDFLNIIADGIEYKAKISNLSNEEIVCEIIEKEEKNFEGPKITIFQGLAKADKIEYIIQKCSEVGAKEIVPTEMKRCVVKLEEKDKIKKLERWKKIAEVAAKQSLRDNILKIERIAKIEEVYELIRSYDLAIVAYENEKNNSLKKVLKEIKNKDLALAIIIGPEGGLEENEVRKLQENGAKVVTIGKRILRTETAPIVVCGNIMYELEN